MPDNLGLATAYLCWQGTESITYTAKRASGNTTDTVEHALRRALSRKEIRDSNGLFTARDIAWNLPAAELAITDCQENDTITAGAEVWTIREVQLLTKTTRWRFVCVKER